jgi:hypothetical protein
MLCLPFLLILCLPFLLILLPVFSSEALPVFPSYSLPAFSTDTLPAFPPYPLPALSSNTLPDFSSYTLPAFFIKSCLPILHVLTSLSFFFPSNTLPAFPSLIFLACSARDWDRNRILGEIPRVVVQKSALSKGPL